MEDQKTSDNPNFITLDEAAAMTEGTRITFIPGIQALYAEALKNICFAKGIPIIRALHPLMGIDKATGKDRQARLFELTRQTGLPTMFFNDERPRNVWTEQLALAESMEAIAVRRLFLKILSSGQKCLVCARLSWPKMAWSGI